MADLVGDRQYGVVSSMGTLLGSRWLLYPWSCALAKVSLQDGKGHRDGEASDLGVNC